ncbi:MAG: saccharopine dehydrogenase NADP-binding domain-containing protein [Bacilli bacterium]|jgi:homospermidine synthase|nr:hypothetical protein [Erysipelotrichia bacterium]
MKKHFANNIIILGYGLVGKSVLRLLKKEIDFDFNKLYVIEQNKEDLEQFLLEGGKKENYLVHKVTFENYKEIYSKYLNKGDALLDFSEGIKNIDSFSWCLEKGVYYLSTSESCWPHEDSSFSLYANFVEIKKLRKKYKRGYPSTVLQYGCNPGLVSTYAKLALHEIINCSTHEDIVNKKTFLLDLIKQDKYAQVAKLLEIETIIISDHDTSSVNGLDDKNTTLYNTWSPSGLYDEAFSRVELSLGTNFNHSKILKSVYKYNQKDGYCMLNKIGVETLEETYAPNGKFFGHIIAHEETISLGSYFALTNIFKKLKYMPSVYFIYRPSEIALSGLAKAKLSGNKAPTSYVRLSDTLTRGEEYVGVIMHSSKYGNYYLGSGVEINKLRSVYPQETPTIIQVTASCVAAFKWMIDHPYEGIVLPEEIPVEFIVKNTKKYLGDYVFEKIDEDIIPLNSLFDN